MPVRRPSIFRSALRSPLRRKKVAVSSLSRVRSVSTGKVPGIDQSTFAEAAEGAKDGCPISGAMKGNVDLSVEATLER